MVSNLVRIPGHVRSSSAVRKSEYVACQRKWTSLLCHRHHCGHFTVSNLVRIPGHVSSKEVRIRGHVRIHVIVTTVGTSPSAIESEYLGMSAVRKSEYVGMSEVESEYLGMSAVGKSEYLGMSEEVDIYTLSSSAS